jgi:hypothetical protein
VGVLRSFEWDGPPPAVGDRVVTGDGWWRVVAVAEGPGPGQWRLDVEPIDGPHGERGTYSWTARVW